MIDKNSPIPVYYQLKTELIDKISNGVWAPGDCIASERELCDIYGVSRMTIRQAIGELVQDGILNRIKGKGTFVCEPQVRQKDMMSFTEIIKQTGKELKTEIIDFLVKPTPDNLIEEFQCEKMYSISRKRMVENKCIAVEKVMLPVNLIEGLNEDLLKSSLYNLLDQAGYIVEYSDSTIASLLPDDKLKDLFEVEKDVPFLKINSKTFCQKNRLLFIEEAIYRSDKFKLNVNISRREGKIK